MYLSIRGHSPSRLFLIKLRSFYSRTVNRVEKKKIEKKRKIIITKKNKRLCVESFLELNELRTKRLRADHTDLIRNNNRPVLYDMLYRIAISNIDPVTNHTRRVYLIRIFCHP